MAIQTNGNYEYYRTGYAERMKERQAAETAGLANAAEKAAAEKETGRKYTNGYVETHSHFYNQKGLGKCKKMSELS